MSPEEPYSSRRREFFKTDRCPEFGTPEFIEKHGDGYLRNTDGTPKLDKDGEPIRCLSYDQIIHAQGHGY